MAELTKHDHKALINRAEYILFRGLLLLIRLLPQKTLPFIGSAIGSFFYRFGVRRDVVTKNLEIAFGNELTKEDIQTICHKTYRNYGIVLLEVLLLNFIPPEKIHQYIEIEGLDTLNDALSDDKGIIIAGNHMGNWELFSAGLAAQGAPFHLYVGKQRNKLFDNALNAIRSGFGVSTISKSKTASIQMVKILKKNGILAMAGDLNVPADKLFVDFFGKKAAVGRGLSSFTVSQKATLLFIYTVREGPLKHRGYIHKIEYQLSGDSKEDCSRVAQTLSTELENKVRQFPDQYFWFNRRWKTRPGDEDIQSLY